MKIEFKIVRFYIYYFSTTNKLLAVRLISAFLFIFSCLAVMPSAEAQSSECSSIEELVLPLYKRFSRFDPKETQTKIDSIWKHIPPTCYQAKMYALIVKGKCEKANGNLELATKLTKQALFIANNKGDVVSQKQYIGQLSVIESEKGDYDRSLQLIDSALQIPCLMDSIKCLKQNIKLKINSGVEFYQKGNIYLAIDQYLQADSMFHIYQLKDSIYEVAIFNALGNIYDTEFEDYQSSLLNYKKALEYCPIGHQSKFSLYNNIGNRFNSLDEIDSAKYYFKKTIDQCTSPRYLVTPYQGLGDIAMKEIQYDKAESLYKLAVINAETSGNFRYLNESKGLLGKVFYEKGDFDKADKIFKTLDDRSKSVKELVRSDMEFRLYSTLVDVARYNKNLSYEMSNIIFQQDSLQRKSRLDFLNKSISRYEKQILKDSLTNVAIISEKQKLEIQNNRLSLGLLGLLLLGSLITLFQLLKFRSHQKAKIEELVFEKDELIIINKRIEETLKSLSIQKSTMGSSIKIKSRDKIHNLNLDDIKYVKAEDNGVRIFYEESSLWLDISLKHFENLSENNDFIKIYRSTVVNLKYVEWINHVTLRLKGDIELKIGRAYKKIILQRISKT